MTTTAVFAEMLVAGIEAMVWIGLLVLAIACPKVGNSSIVLDVDALNALKEWVTLITTIFLALAYGVGIVVDRVADSLFSEFFRDSSSDVSLLRLHVLARGDKVTDFLEYIRTRMRVARSTTVNLALTVIVAPVFLTRCTQASPCQTLAAVMVLSALTSASAFAGLRIAGTYDKRVRQAAVMRFHKPS
jgi:hypothetical protein